jgi:hypothetical protein
LAAEMRVIASRYDWLHAPVLPRLMLMTWPGWHWPAGRGGQLAAAVDAGRPLHADQDVGVVATAFPRTRTGITLTPLPTLAMPTPLFVVAPIRPSVCVPCHEERDVAARKIG